MIDLRAAWSAVKGAWSVIRLCLFAAAVLAACLYGRSCGRKESAAELERLKATHAQALAESASQLARLATDYRERERAMGADFIAATARHSEALRRAETQRDRLAADLRAGTVRLQERWAGCVSAAAQTPGRAGGTDATADDRHRSAARIIGAADRCAADVVALQSFLIAERQ